MRKLILFLITAISISLLAGPDGVGSSKVGALSGTDGTTSPAAMMLGFPGRSAVYDVSDVLMFPHLSNKYHDTLHFFYAGANAYNGFGTFQISDGLTIGMADFKQARNIYGLEGTDENSPHTYSLFGGYNMGTMDLGFAINYWGDTNEAEVKDSVADVTQSTTTNSAFFDLLLSLGMDLGGGSGFDSFLFLSFGTYTYEAYNSASADPKTVLMNESDGIINFTLGGRYFMPLSKRVKMTAWGYFDYQTDGYKEVAYDPADNNAKINPMLHSQSGYMLNLGTSFEIKSRNEKMVVTPYLGFIYGAVTELDEDTNGDDSGSKDETTNSAFVAPYVGISFEAKITDWLTFFTSYSKVVGILGSEEAILRQTEGADPTQDATATTSDGLTDSGFSTGFSIHSDDMALIATLNNDIFVNGPYMFSGSTTNHMMATVTFVYKFDVPFLGDKKVKRDVTKVETKKSLKTAKKATKVKEIKKEKPKKEAKTDQVDDDDLF